MIDAKVATGSEMRGPSKRYTAARLLAFSGGSIGEPGWPKKNIHTDTEFARSTGLPARCASGTQFQGQMVEFLIELFGDRWLSSGTMNVRFVDLVLEDQTVIPRCKVTGTRPDPKAGTRIDMEIWSERDDGRQVMIGTASGLVA